MAELHYLTLLQLSALIERGAVSSVEATEAQLARIAALDGRLRSYATVTAGPALAQAAAADAELAQGRRRGPLHGVPIAVKDLCDTAGIVTAGGMPILKDRVPERDATVVARLKAAGAVILGKLQMTEGAFADHHPDVARPINPWDEAAWAGASSSGSGVAAAAGLAYGDLGSDTGGSIRFPCAMNGVTGVKPTWGRVSRHGVLPLSDSLDHIGPMARTAADCAALLGAIAGADPDDPTALRAPVPDYLAGLARGIDGARGFRIGVDPEFNGGEVEPLVERSTAAAAEMLAEIGAELVPIRFPDTRAVVEGWGPFCAVETALLHAATYPSRKAEYGPTLAGFIDSGRAVTALDLARHLIARDRFKGALAQLFETVDLVLIPAMDLAGPSFERMSRLDDPAELARLLTFTAPFDMTGSPTLTMPCGVTAGGVPVGFQLVGRHLSEDLLLRAGHAFQQATDWHSRHPEP